VSCRCCGGCRGTHKDGARGEYCRRCYKRWLDAGFPAGGPQAPRHSPGGHGTRAGRLEDYSDLRSWGLSQAEAVTRMGITRRTAQRYDDLLASGLVSAA
jgi:hypothetical protein